jgi:TPR repeat protein
MRRSLYAVIPLALVVAVGWSHGRAGQSEREMIAEEARNGDPGAELLYGLSIMEGRYGLKPNPKEGLQWIEKAARGGNPYAALRLGNAYADGVGLAPDSAQAVAWWQRAAEAGNEAARYRLGMAYLEGKGVARDVARGAAILKEAAAGGNVHAQYELGRMYHEGYAVVQDQSLARDWLGQAAAQGYGKALNLLAVVNALVKATTPVSQESYSALLDRAEGGDPQAQYELGLRYENGAAEVNRDPGKALKWLTRAAKNGNLLAMHRLARVYAKGELGVARDSARAAYWRQRARGKARLGKAAGQETS